MTTKRSATWLSALALVAFIACCTNFYSLAVTSNNSNSAIEMSHTTTARTTPERLHGRGPVVNSTRVFAGGGGAGGKSGGPIKVTTTVKRDGRSDNKVTTNVPPNALPGAKRTIDPSRPVRPVVRNGPNYRDYERGNNIRNVISPSRTCIKDDASFNSFARKGYCLERSRWVERQNALSAWYWDRVDPAELKEYSSSMTLDAPLLSGRCEDLVLRLGWESACSLVGHRQKPFIKLAIRNLTWMALEIDLGLHDCPASRCNVSILGAEARDTSSHIHLAMSNQTVEAPDNARVELESMRVSGKVMPDKNTDWLASHRLDGFSSSNWIPLSYVNSDEHMFRMKGKDHKDRRREMPVFISNCRAASGRDRIIKHLGKYIPIEQFSDKCKLKGAATMSLASAYPQCADQPPRRGGMWNPQKECVYFHSMFAFVAENTYEENYVTEKLFQPLKVGSIPVIAGDPDLYRRHLPSEGAAIFLEDFPDYASSAEYMRKVMDDPVAWKSHLAWKDEKEELWQDGFKFLARHSFATLACDLCDKYGEEVLPVSENAWNRSLSIDVLKPCASDLLSRHGIPEDLPLIDPAFGIDALLIVHYNPLKERKKVMIQRVRDHFGVDPIFVTNYDQEDLTEEHIECIGDRRAQHAFIHRPTTKGEDSLSVKHMAVYYYTIQHSLRNVLVLEDDATFLQPDWRSSDSLWQTILRDLPADYDAVFLSGCCGHNHGERITEHLYLAQSSRVSSMYMISQKGARNMLRSLPLVAPIDRHINYAAGGHWNDWMNGSKIPGGRFHGPRT
eukprot:CAMPEP_0113595116 /NCGR_PEP_ID=MMETSP0015_2-20120614/39467_1 /TAXON_ID=2838 /ORGANISM="Odontella" /LENGTH=786 /DNA_ID=CAMNT_0000502215 /DNA_START=238 /DNA_END=2593 /DNA_ORIENTATION=+ /assembly_acc=CAM_ASM_000160